MKNSLRTFVVAAVVGLGVLALAGTPVLAQYRRPTPVRPVPRYPVAPVYPVVPRVPTTVPPIQGYTNPYVVPGMTLNQLATLDVLSMDPVLMMQLRLYNASRAPVVIAPTYPINPYAVPTLPYNRIGTPGAYNPYNYYNPYFAAYGLHP